MKQPHLLRVEAPPETFAPLLVAARDQGLRLGWLELAAVAEDTPPPGPLPPSLTAAADLGVLRAVAIAGRRTVSVKPAQGPPVLHDLLREHFRGCAAVLVHGPGAPPDTPRLTPDPATGGWRIHPPDGAARIHPTQALLDHLRRPRPWG